MAPDSGGGSGGGAAVGWGGAGAGDRGRIDGGVQGGSCGLLGVRAQFWPSISGGERASEGVVGAVLGRSGGGFRVTPLAGVVGVGGRATFLADPLVCRFFARSGGIGFGNLRVSDLGSGMVPHAMADSGPRAVAGGVPGAIAAVSAATGLVGDVVLTYGVEQPEHRTLGVRLNADEKTVVGLLRSEQRLVTVRSYASLNSYCGCPAAVQDGLAGLAVGASSGCWSEIWISESGEGSGSSPVLPARLSAAKCPLPSSEKVAGIHRWLAEELCLVAQAFARSIPVGMGVCMDLTMVQLHGTVVVSSLGYAHANAVDSGFASGRRSAPVSPLFVRGSSVECAQGVRPFASVVPHSLNRISAGNLPRIVRPSGVVVDVWALLPLVGVVTGESPRSLWAQAYGGTSECPHSVCGFAPVVIRMKDNGSVVCPQSLCGYAPYGEFAPIGDLHPLFGAAHRAPGACWDAPREVRSMPCVVQADGVIVTSLPTTGEDADFVADCNHGNDIPNPLVVTCMDISSYLIGTGGGDASPRFGK